LKKWDSFKTERKEEEEKKRGFVVEKKNKHIKTK
jgi:hypothetical protein